MEFRDFKKLIKEYVDDHYENFGFYPYEVEIDGQVYSYGGYWAILDDDRFDKVEEVYLMDKNLEKLADQYEGNLLNYFCGMTPSQSKKFNKMVKDAKKNRRSKK